MRSLGRVGTRTCPRQVTDGGAFASSTFPLAFPPVGMTGTTVKWLVNFEMAKPRAERLNFALLEV